MTTSGIGGDREITARDVQSLASADAVSGFFAGLGYDTSNRVIQTPTALADVGVLALPTCLMVAPRNHRPEIFVEALEDNLSAMNRSGSKNTQPFNQPGHPACRCASPRLVSRQACK